MAELSGAGANVEVSQEGSHSEETRGPHRGWTGPQRVHRGRSHTGFPHAPHMRGPDRLEAPVCGRRRGPLAGPGHGPTSGGIGHDDVACVRLKSVGELSGRGLRIP